MSVKVTDTLGGVTSAATVVVAQPQPPVGVTFSFTRISPGGPPPPPPNDGDPYRNRNSKHRDCGKLPLGLRQHVLPDDEQSSCSHLQRSRRVHGEGDRHNDGRTHRSRTERSRRTVGGRPSRDRRGSASDSGATRPLLYHSEYLVPSSAVASEPLLTSYTPGATMRSLASKSAGICCQVPADFVKGSFGRFRR